MLLFLAAAAALALSPSGDRAAVRINVAGLDRPAAHAAIGKASRLACKAVAADSADFAQCVDEAIRRGQLDYEQLTARRALAVASAR